MVLLTIQRMDPEGCSTWCEPLHLAFTVARPKSPIFTVSPSCKKMSAQQSRNYTEEKHILYTRWIRFCFFGVFFPINRHWKTNRKDTVWFHVSVNDVLCMKIAENEEKNNYIPVIVDLILRKKWDSVQLTPCPEQSAWQYLWAGSFWNLSPGHVCACRGCYPHTTVSQWPGCP